MWFLLSSQLQSRYYDFILKDEFCVWVGMNYELVAKWKFKKQNNDIILRFRKNEYYHFTIRVP